MARLRPSWILLALALLAAGVFTVWALRPGPVERKPLALITSLPIYWPDGADIAALVDGDAQPPWTRRVLERHYELKPLDTLVADSEMDGGGSGRATDPLAGIERLAIIQPRALAPADLVALDEWVRAGGHLLYAIDPMLTGQYEVPLGDPRHPAIVALVPPVFARWGIEVSFTEQQPLGLRWIDTGSGKVPVALAGELGLLSLSEMPADAPEPARCTLEGEAIVARCTLGKGRITVIADAAMFEFDAAGDEEAEAILALMQSAFD